MGNTKFLDAIASLESGVKVSHQSSKYAKASGYGRVSGYGKVSRYGKASGYG